MKRRFMIKTVLLMITLSILGSIPAFASMGITGSLDLFNESRLSGWVVNKADTATPLTVQIQIANTSTGEIIDTITTEPSHTRQDLIAQAGPNSTPAFTVPVNMEKYPDGSYSATAYANGSPFSQPLYYTKGETAETYNGSTLKSLGTYRLTAYCPCRSCSAGWGRQTSSGATATAKHTVAVDRKVIPMGSKLLINGTVYTAEDVGGGVKGKHIDIFHESHNVALQFGSQRAEVFLIQ